MRLEIYRRSGLFSATGPFIVGLVGLLCAVIGAIPYVFILQVIPYIYLKILATVGFIFLLGYTVIWTGEWSKIRNLPLTVLLAGMVGLMGFYFSWVVLVVTLLEDRQVIFNPVSLFDIANYLAENGRWEKDGKPILSQITWVLWSLEALALPIGAISIGFIHFRGLPFCERCGLWVKQRTEVGPFSPDEDEESFIQQLRDGTLEPLFNLSPADVHPWWTLSLRYCRKCEDFYLANLNRIDLAKDGHPKAKVLLRNLVLDKKIYNRLWEMDKPDALKKG